MKLTDLLYEIGDATAKPFRWTTRGSVDMKLKQFAVGINNQKSYMNWLGPMRFTYEATSDKHQDPTIHSPVEYEINMEVMGRKRLALMLPGKPKPKQKGPDYEMEVWISFTVWDSDEDTNLNEQYRVMATVIECVQDFIKKASKIYLIKEINILPKSDTGSDPSFDSRRGRLYLAYVKRNISKLPGKWTAYADSEGISIKNGDWSGGDIVAKS